MLLPRHVVAMDNFTRPWREDDVAIRSVVASAKHPMVTVGGRFVCAKDADEDAMFADLTKLELNLCDSGQCEIVVSRQSEPTEVAIRRVIYEFRQIAAERSYRLQAVEVGEIEAGHATVVANEVGYIPWWSDEGNDC
jgi:hypothetical protein